MTASFSYRENLLHASAHLGRAAEDLEAAVTKGVMLDVPGILASVMIAVMSLADAEPEKCREIDHFRALLEPIDRARGLGGVVPLGPVLRTPGQKEVLLYGSGFSHAATRQMVNGAGGAYLDGEVVIVNLLDAIRATAAHDPEQEFEDPMIRDIVEMLGPRPDPMPINDNGNGTGAA